MNLFIFIFLIINSYQSEFRPFSYSCNTCDSHFKTDDLDFIKKRNPCACHNQNFIDYFISEENPITLKFLSDGSVLYKHPTGKGIDLATTPINPICFGRFISKIVYFHNIIQSKRASSITFNLSKESLKIKDDPLQSDPFKGIKITDAENNSAYPNPFKVFRKSGKSDKSENNVVKITAPVLIFQNSSFGYLFRKKLIRKTNQTKIELLTFRCNISNSNGRLTFGFKLLEFVVSPFSKHSEMDAPIYRLDALNVSVIPFSNIFSSDEDPFYTVNNIDVLEFLRRIVLSNGVHAFIDVKSEKVTCEKYNLFLQKLPMCPIYYDEILVFYNKIPGLVLDCAVDNVNMVDYKTQKISDRIKILLALTILVISSNIILFVFYYQLSNNGNLIDINEKKKDIKQIDLKLKLAHEQLDEESTNSTCSDF